jgi:hypothetical protein
MCRFGRSSIYLTSPPVPFIKFYGMVREVNECKQHEEKPGSYVSSMKRSLEVM